MLGFLTSKDRPAGYPYRKKCQANVKANHAGAMVPGHRGALLVAKLVELSVDHITEKIGAIGVARATGGVPVLVCNLDLDLWILGYRYGYVSMTHYITPVGLSA